MDVLQRAKMLLGIRKQAYCATFERDEAQPVLKDLARFCRATESTFHPDPRVQAVQEGRREVWLRIQEHLNMTEDELWSLRRPDRGDAG